MISYSLLSSKFDELKIQNEAIQQENLNLKTIINNNTQKINNQENFIQNLESKVEKMKQQELNNDVIIMGIPDNSITSEKVCDSLFQLMNLNNEPSKISYHKLIELKNTNKNKSDLLTSKWLLRITFQDFESKKMFMLEKKSLRLFLLNKLDTKLMMRNKYS